MMAYGYGPAAPLIHLVFSIFWLIVILAVLGALIRYVRGGGRHHRRFLRDDSALDLLRERYAKGEINREEFEEKKRDLSA